MKDEFKYVIDYVLSDNTDFSLTMRQHPRRSGKTTLLVNCAIKLVETDNVLFFVPQRQHIHHTLNIFNKENMYDCIYKKHEYKMYFSNGNFIAFETPESNLHYRYRGCNIRRCSIISDECKPITYVNGKFQLCYLNVYYDIGIPSLTKINKVIQNINYD